MLYYSYDDFKVDIKNIVDNIDFEPDAIVAISRGGLTIAHFLGIAFDLREVYTINAVSYSNNVQHGIEITNIPQLSNVKNVLIVDEIVDTGISMQKVVNILKEINESINFKTASIFYKNTSCFKPNYYVRETDSWVEFFWEVDIVKGIEKSI